MKTLTTVSIILGKQLELNTAKIVCMKKYFFLLTMLALVSCRKSSEKFSLTGKFVDDITGEPVTGSGAISVDGNTWGNDVWFSTSYEEGIGNGSIKSDGSFSATFKTKSSDHYIFWFRQTNKSKDYWYPDNITINRDKFIGGRKDTMIRLPRLTLLKVNFRNISPFDNNDRLNIGVYSISAPSAFDKQWENLQNCVLKVDGLYGGPNAQGTLSAVVASDRGAMIYWEVRKNGTEKGFKDTAFCSRNAITTYQINY
jgi:hypothetical protein